MIAGTFGSLQMLPCPAVPLRLPVFNCYILRDAVMGASSESPRHTEIRLLPKQQQQQQ